MQQYKDQSNLYSQRASQGPHPDNPQLSAHYFSPNVVTGTAPSLPTNQMNGVGPVGRPAYYGPANPPSQTNGVPGSPGLPGSPGQPFSPNLVNRSPMGQQQRRPIGVYHSPTIVPSPQSQGGLQQTPASPMGPLGSSLHMNRAFPPPNDPGHPQGSGSVGSAPPTPSPAHPQLVRPQSNNDTSSQNHMNPHTLSGRLTPSQKRSHIDETRGSPEVELTSFPADVMGEAQVRGGFHDREVQSPAAREKVGNCPSLEGIFLTSRHLSCSMLSALGKADHFIAAFGVLKPTCTSHCKIVDLLHSRCNSSYPCSHNALQRGIILPMRRYAVLFQRPSLGGRPN
jgi:hypothetical protein